MNQRDGEVVDQSGGSGSTPAATIQRELGEEFGTTNPGQRDQDPAEEGGGGEHAIALPKPLKVGPTLRVNRAAAGIIIILEEIVAIPDVV